jgi:hypothetical protein
MKLIIGLLCVQLVAGLAGAYVSFAYVHWAAMGKARGYGMQKEFEQVQRSPDYKEPPKIKGYSHSDLVASMKRDADIRGEIALFSLLFSLGTSLSAAFLLFLLYRIQRSKAATASSQ